MPTLIDLFIFDLDGTLIDSRADIALAANLMLKELGFAEIPLNTVVGYIGEGVRLLVERALVKSSPDKKWSDSEIDDAVTVFRIH
jgi:phosphoglycolate phosphatase